MAGFLHALLSDLRKEHRLPKLLISGAGEVTMVMLGVLLALGVQNWNDDRKDAIKETKLLREMRENLNADLSDCRWNIDFNERALQGNRTVLRQLDHRIPFTDTMRVHYATLFGCTQLVANTSAYDNLKSIGFHLIRTDSLRKAITVLYSERYTYLRSMELDMDAPQQTDRMASQIADKLVVDSMWVSARPVDPEALMDDASFMGTLRMNIFFRGYMIGQYRRVEEQILRLQALIDAELAEDR
jgi:hypothetical protein